MSTWCNARSSAAALSLSLFCLLVACSPGDEADAARAARSNTVTVAEMRVDAIPQEEPGLARHVWRTANPAARDVAGNLAASLEEGRGGPLALAFANGITLRVEQLGVHGAATRIGPEGEATFQTLLALPEQVEARVYRVLEEVTTRSANKRGLCGEDRTTSVALAEFVDEDGDWVMRIAAFKGAAQPGGAEGDPGVCGAFAYQQPQ